MSEPVEQNNSAAPLKQPSAEKREMLKAIVGELCEVEPAQIGADFVLSSGRLRSSLGRATLDAKIRRRLGVKVENLRSARTFGELEAALASGQAPMAVIGQNVPAVPPEKLAETDHPQKNLVLPLLFLRTCFKGFHLPPGVFQFFLFRIPAVKLLLKFFELLPCDGQRPQRFGRPFDRTPFLS